MIEGWVVRVSWLHVMYWIIKGYNHPEYGYIAIPYRLGDKRIELGEMHRIVPESMLRYVDCIGRYAVVLPHNMIDLYIDPSKVLEIRMSELPGVIVELLEQLDPEWAGITGSWAVFSEKRGSDVDLLLYSYSHESIYDRLTKLKNQGLISDCNLRKHNLDIPRQHGFQLLDACYKGIKYTLRILRRIDKAPCSDIIIPIGKYQGLIRITSSREAYLVPAIYDAIIDDLGEIVIETWHTRYQEMLPGIYIANLNLSYDLKRGTILASPDIDGFIEGIG